MRINIQKIATIFIFILILCGIKAAYDTYMMYGIASVIILVAITLIAIYCFYSGKSQRGVRMTGRQRDPQRYFSPKQRQVILQKQHNRCKICGARLDHRATQYDHRIPWSQGGRTNVKNGQALCANCHAKKCYNERSKK